MSDFVRVRLTGESARRLVKTYRVNPEEWGRVVEACDWVEADPGIVVRELLNDWARRELEDRDRLASGGRPATGFATLR